MLTQPHRGVRAALAALLAVIALAPASFAPPSFASERRAVVRGHLDPASLKSSLAPDAPLTFVTNDGKRYQVAGDTMSNAQLRDPQLLEREWEFEGALRPDGRFEIIKLFTIKDGQRFRVTYYCEICNIVTHEPGDCMCCQGPTELREIPGE